MALRVALRSQSVSPPADPSCQRPARSFGAFGAEHSALGNVAGPLQGNPSSLSRTAFCGTTVGTTSKWMRSVRRPSPTPSPKRRSKGRAISPRIRCSSILPAATTCCARRPGTGTPQPTRRKGTGCSTKNTAPPSMPQTPLRRSISNRPRTAARANLGAYGNSVHSSKSAK